MTADLYVLRSRPMPWGDYGAILAHGMSARLSRCAGRIQLERTGPFIPPWTFPGIGDVIVTNAVRIALASSGLSGASFAAVDVAHVVRLDWQDWDRSADAPREHPSSGAPEDYILGRPHDAAVANFLGPLWELRSPIQPGVGRRQRLSKVPARYHTTVASSAAPEEDFLRVGTLRHLLVSQRAKRWLEDRFAEWLTFDPVEPA